MRGKTLPLTLITRTTQSSNSSTNDKLKSPSKNQNLSSQCFLFTLGLPSVCLLCGWPWFTSKARIHIHSFTRKVPLVFKIKKINLQLFHFFFLAFILGQQDWRIQWIWCCDVSNLCQKLYNIVLLLYLIRDFNGLKFGRILDTLANSMSSTSLDYLICLII